MPLEKAIRVLFIAAHHFAAQPLTTRSAAARLVIWLAWFKIKIAVFMVSLLSSPLLSSPSTLGRGLVCTIYDSNVPEGASVGRPVSTIYRDSLLIKSLAEAQLTEFPAPIGLIKGARGAVAGR